MTESRTLRAVRPAVSRPLDETRHLNVLAALPDTLAAPERRLIERLISRAITRSLVLTAHEYPYRPPRDEPPSHERCPPTPASRQLDDRVCQAFAFLLDHFSDATLRLDDLAAHLGLSKWHLVRLLKKNTGLGFRDTVRTLRLNRAADLLVTTSMGVKEIAAVVGYKYSNELSRDFRRVFGVTASSLRRATIGQDDIPPTPAAPL
jgi:transcriptional regulator GlxA family with amidase domain